MSKSIAELRKSPHVGLPERSYDLCLASTLTAEVQTLLSDLEDARAAAGARIDDDTPGKPKRMADGGAVKKIRARLTVVRDEMREHTGTLTLRGIDEGKWRLWVEAHPAREDSERDNRIAHGYCNGDDLIDNLATFAAAWNGDPLKPAVYDADGELVEPGDWDWIRSKAAPGDLLELASLVVVMHESVIDVPKLLNASPAILGGESA